MSRSDLIKLAVPMAVLIFLSVAYITYAFNREIISEHAVSLFRDDITEAREYHEDEINTDLHEKAEYTVDQIQEESEGEQPYQNTPIAYLTFDDGPSGNTIKILDVLAGENIPATFFVIGNNLSGDKDIYRQIVYEGHAIANHTYTHNYFSLYRSVDAFMADLIKLEQFLLEETGVLTDMMRFPGGSSLGLARSIAGYDVIRSITRAVKNRGYDYFDWNVDSGDSKAGLSSKQIIKNVLDTVDELEGDVVILFHDSKGRETTVEALPLIIEQLRARGYEFMTLSPGAVDIKHR